MKEEEKPLSGEFGATDSIRQASEAQTRSQEALSYFQSLLASRDIKSAKRFARGQNRNGNRIFTILLKQAEEDARQQINRP